MNDFFKLVSEFFSYIMKNLSTIKDVLLVITGIIGPTVAIIGLNSWKRQLTFKVDYELSKAILLDLYSLRESITFVRSPIMLAEEQIVPQEEIAKAKTENEKQAMQIGFAYQRRWDKVGLAITNLNVRMLEAEVLWGKEIKELFTDLYKMTNELWFAIKNYVRDIQKGREYNHPEDKLKARDNVLYSFADEEKDVYAYELNKQVEKIEALLRTKLKR